ncbi:Reverse transcriptase, RNA-dependent DNA polymerase [Corchorus capsularis]|uniref:Reverse transcriptase, RNA-dependent DNA polymerase n=1 Tax=Corchorus capsularis TaxID=210143 RepID=A0A1R3HZM8_COCAP|nr:Reverse transcriptase, RNA-dependent DNA polymerase [Corchorus capsularis]
MASEQVLSSTSSAALSSTSSTSSGHTTTSSLGFSLSTTNAGTTNFNHPVQVRLDRNNFHLWRSQLLPVIGGHNLIGYIDGNLPCPSQTILNTPTTESATSETPSLVQNPQFAAWQRQDQLLLGWILSSLTEPVLPQVVGCLGPEYESLVVSVSTRSEPVTMDDLHSLLLGYEYRLEQHTLSEPITANIATKTNSSAPRPPRNQELGRGSFCCRGRGRGRSTPSLNSNASNGNFTDRPQCQVCSKFGHFALDCFHRFEYGYQSSQTTNSSALMASSSTISQDDWYPDFGASNHLTADLSNMSIHSDVSQFAFHNNVYFEFRSSHCLVKDLFSGQVLLKGVLDDGLYRLLPIPSSQTSHSFQALVGECVSSDLWHQWLEVGSNQNLSCPTTGLPPSSLIPTVMPDTLPISQSNTVSSSNSSSSSPPSFLQSLSPSVSSSSQSDVLSPTSHDSNQVSIPSPLPLPITTKTHPMANKIPSWRSAMVDEYNALLKNGTWVLASLPPGKNVINCKWVFRLKRKSDGSIERHKVRLVAKGFNQEEGVDYTETFSLVIKLVTIRVVITLALKHANGKLQKAIYGLKQAPRAWFQKLSSRLLKLGFANSKADSSMFIHHTTTRLIIILVYVDDIIITGSDNGAITSLVSDLDKSFKLKDLGPLNYFLGVDVQSCSSDVVLSQQKYIHDLLSRKKMDGTKICNTPAATNYHLSKYVGEPFSDVTLYRSTIGALQYDTITRPEIAYYVNKVYQFMQAPTQDH